jgi:pilus assembly protein CpaC
MHRTLCRFRSLAGGALLAMLACAVAGLRSQDALPRTAAVIVPLNGTIRLQMSNKQPISKVVNPKENAVAIRTIPGDPTTVLLIGQQPDVTRIELTDVNGRTETYEIIVQSDIEYLRTQLRRAVPTANVTPIPTSNNTVILAGTVSRAEDIGVIMSVVQSVGFQAVNAMRVGGVQQVQLDVVLVEVDRSELRTMAFNFLANSRAWYLGSTVGQAVTNPLVAGSTFGEIGGLGPTFTGTQTISGIPGTPNGFPTNILGGVVSNRAGFLGFLEALRQENLAKVLAEPRLVTLSGRPASFLAGGEQAVPVPAGLGQVGVQFEEFGTRLNFIPIVLGNGKIHLEVEPEFSALNAANGTNINGTIVPGRTTSRVNTTVELETGQTFVIGGLIQNVVQASMLKVPVLGDLPFLGSFFSGKSYQETETELLVLVTPWLVDPESCDQRPKVLPGLETRRPDDFELFLENLIEVPRGPRKVCQDHRYIAAYKNSPSWAAFPCPGTQGGMMGGPAGGPGGCGPGGCGVPGGPPAGEPGAGPAGSGGPAIGPAAPAGSPGPALPTGPGPNLLPPPRPVGEEE